MRPKKAVLCVEANEQELSRRALLFDVRGFRVLRATTFDGALRVLREHRSAPVSVVVVGLSALWQSVEFANAMVRALKDIDPDVRVLLTLPWRPAASRCMDGLLADGFLGMGQGVGNAELVERVKVLAERKRGPKKPVQRVEAAPRLELEEACA